MIQQGRRSSFSKKAFHDSLGGIGLFQNLQRDVAVKPRIDRLVYDPESTVAERLADLKAPDGSEISLDPGLRPRCLACEFRFLRMCK